MERTERYAFGDFVLERSQQRVQNRAGETLSLTPRLFAALLFFVERPGELVDKETLFRELWPDLVVEENNLSQVISGLRRELGDDTQASRYIQTVPRRGFRFVAAVTPLSSEIPANAAPSVVPHLSNATAITETAPVQTPLQVQEVASTRNALDARQSAKRRTLKLTLLSATVVFTGGGLALFYGRKPHRAAASVNTTIAVLPFKPLVNDGRDELFEIGMADSLIARLSMLPNVIVRSVGSVRRYAGYEQDALKAARELDVMWIVDGSIQRRDEQIKISARLLSVPSQVAEWSGSFNEKVANLFDLQDTIAERIARILAPKLYATRDTRAEAKRDGGTRNADAYQLYLAARHHAQGIRAAGLRKSVALYHQAIDVDPDYALAFAGLAETYRRMVFGADVSPIEAFEPAKIAAKRALVIAPNLAEAHAALGWILFWFDYDWPGAERVFREAIAFNANVSEAHFGLGHLLICVGRSDEGIQHIATARELDPMSLIINSLEAGFLLGRGKRDEASQRLTRAREIDPDFWVTHLTMGGLFLFDKKPDSALESFRRADALADESTQATAVLGAQLARMGKADEARTVLKKLIVRQTERYVPPTSVATIYAALGENNLALDALERAYAVRDSRLCYMKNDGRWNALRAEPRFVALMQRMKLDTNS
jgi:DNA-binding winged helix-turn-helix (wHTH) protein/TolB-like protein/Tfp pilus assembly protein PilF